MKYVFFYSIHDMKLCDLNPSKNGILCLLILSLTSCSLDGGPMHLYKRIML